MFVFYLFYLNIDIHKIYNQYNTITNNANIHLEYSHTSSPSIGKKKTFMVKSKTFYYTEKTKSGVSS